MQNAAASRRRAWTRSRGLLIAAGVLIAILVIQMATSVIGAVLAQQQATDAAKDTFSYVGDVTAERVGRYAASGEEVVESVASTIEDASEMNLDRAARILYLNLSRTPEVRGAYVGFPDGSFVSVSHDGTGYQSRRVKVDPEYSATLSTYDSQFKFMTSENLDLDFDPRARPWYISGSETPNTVWTQPYLVFDSDITFASVARAARTSNTLKAVVAADLDVEKMGEVLDTLPFGDGAEAFVFSPDRRVIAAPSQYSDQLREIAGLTGQVPTASDIGIGSEAAASNDENGDVYGVEDGRITLERGFPREEGLDWILRLESDEGQLSPGLDRLQVTIVAITAFSALMVVAVAMLIYRMWRPLRRLSVRARTDELTGLANRHEYRSRGAALLRRAEARGEAVLVAAFDLDHFKAMNDEFGHDAGDTALTIVGNALIASSRDTDVVARLGGDEFVLVQIIADRTPITVVVERVRAHVQDTVQLNAPGGERIGVTAGVSETRPGMFDLDILMAEADSALLGGKRRARGATYRYERSDAAE